MEIAEHVDEITTTDREEYIRSQREAAEAAARPAGGDRSTAEPATEPETLLEEFGGKNSGWAARFGEKQRAVGQRGEDAEVAMFDRVFRSKMPNETAADGKLVKAPPRNTVKAFIAERRELAKIQDEDPSFGLGS